MTGITLTDGQKDAVRDMKKWYGSSEQIYTLAGYAGTGKSTLVNYFLNELGVLNDYVTCTFTGKASLNLMKKGVPSSTMHKLMYDIDPQNRFNWIKKDKIKNQDRLKLVVVDEISMVNQQLLDDLISFGIKIVALGDPGQLPAIGQSNSLLDNPNYFLTEIMRQAESNPIIYLSMLAREGKKLEIGPYKDAISGKVKAFVINKSDRTDNMLLKSDQIICGKNASRNGLNDTMRHILFDTDRYLPIKGDKLICTANNWQDSLKSGMPLINGMIGYANDTVYDVDFQHDAFKLEFIEEEYYQNGNDKHNSKHMNRIDASISEFLFNSGAMERPTDYKTMNASIRRVNKALERTEQYQQTEGTTIKLNGVEGLKIGSEYSELNKFDFGYSITCNKAQGSQFDKVYGIEEVLRSDMHHRWLYTLITRAENKLILELQERKNYYGGKRWR